MKKVRLIITGIVAVLILSGSMLSAQMFHPSQGSQTAREPLDIEVWTNKEEGASFGQGENLVIYFRTNRDCYVTLYDLDTRGNINLLYPYYHEDDNFVEGGVVYTIPDFYDDFVLRVNGPPGLEYIQAIASLDYFEVPAWENNFRDGDFWHEIDSDSEALRYLENINYRYFPVQHCNFRCDLDYTHLKVRKNWQYSWDSYYYDDYSYYDTDVYVHHIYHPYYYRPIYHDPWWDPWDWYGVVYIDYPYGGAIWIDGVFYGYAPLFVPRIYIGWHNVRILHGGSVYYSGRVRIKQGTRHDLYHDGKYKWKSKRRGLSADDPIVKKYYSKERSLSYKSTANYTAGGKTSKTNTYKSGMKNNYKTRTGDTKYRSSKTNKNVPSKGKTESTKTYKSRSKNTYKSGKSSETKVKTETKSKTGTKTKTKTKTYDKGSKTKSKSDTGTKSKSKSGTKSKKKSRSGKISSRFEMKDSDNSYSGNKSSSSRGNDNYRSSKSGYGKSGSSYSGKSGRSSKSSGTYSGSKSSSSKSTKSRSSYKSGSRSGSKSGNSSVGRNKSSSGSTKSRSSGSKSKSSGGSSRSKKGK